MYRWSNRIERERPTPTSPSSLSNPVDRGHVRFSIALTDVTATGRRRRLRSDRTEQHASVRRVEELGSMQRRDHRRRHTSISGANADHRRCVWRTTEKPLPYRNVTSGTTGNANATGTGTIPEQPADPDAATVTLTDLQPSSKVIDHHAIHVDVRLHRQHRHHGHVQLHRNGS